MSYTLDQLIDNGGGYVHQDTLEQVRNEVEAELVSTRGNHCQCAACAGGVIHKSDCAVHNMPYEPNGNCDCMAEDYEALWESYVTSRSSIDELTSSNAELETKYAALEKSWIEGSGAYEEITAEVASLREALEKIGELAGRYNNTDFLAVIARNALKDGV